MEKKIVTFGGITNVPDDGLNEAGDMAVLMNMRHKGGELVPCQPPTETTQLNVDKALYHANSGCWILLANGNLEAKKADYSKVLVWAREKYVTSFALMGNIVIINFADRVEYAIWRNGNYEYLGGLPEVPEMSIELSHALTSETSDEEFSYNGYDEENAWAKHSKGFFDKVLDRIYKKKNFVDNALFVVGLRFFDGTYRYSHLYYVKGEGEFNLGDLAISSGVNNFATYITTATGNEKKAKVAVDIVSFSTGFKFDYNLGIWKDVITSVDVFTSGSIMEHEVKKGTLDLLKLVGYGTLDTVSSDVTLYANKAVPQLRNEIEECGNFFRFASYDIKGNLIWSAEETSPSYLSAQEKLPVTNLKQCISNKSSVNNARLHVFDYVEQGNLATKNMLGGFYLSGESAEQPSLVKMDTSVLFKDGTLEKTIYDYTNVGISLEKMSCLISHPTRDIVKTQSAYLDDNVKKNVSAELKNHPTMDMSVCLVGDTTREYRVNYKITGAFTNAYNSNDKAVYNTVFDPVVFLDKIGANPKSFYVLYAPLSSGTDRWFWLLSNGSEVEDIDVENISQYGVYGNVFPATRIEISIEKSECKYDITPVKTTTGEGVLTGKKDKKEAQKSILKVSAVDNPFYFPTAQTYKFEGEIVGLASNAEAISPGQFGTFPLFVFTKEGIWAMGVDTSGQGAYTTQSPFSREVCNGAICPVSGGVVFSTDKGVMVISGGQVADLSAALDGFEVDFFKENADMWNAIFAKAGKDAVVNPVPIREYIKGAVIAYNYHYNEIIVSNKALFQAGDVPYSYVYSLTNKVWSVIDTVFDLTTNKYPELVVFDKGDDKMYTFKDGAAQNKVVAITRPFTLGSIDFKRISQAGLRTTFNGQLNFYVLGSVDGAVFKCITGKEYPSKNGNEPTDVTRRDLITAMSRSKQYKYFAIAVVGDIEGRISMAELLVDAGFANNKIR